MFLLNQHLGKAESTQMRKNLYSSCMSSPLVKTHFKYWTVKFSPLSLSYTPYTHTHTHTHTLKHAHAQTHTHTHTPLNTHTHQHLCTRTNTFSTPPQILNFVQFCVKSQLKAAKLIKVVFHLDEWSSWVVYKALLNQRTNGPKANLADSHGWRQILETVGHGL